MEAARAEAQHPACKENRKVMIRKEGVRERLDIAVSVQRRLLELKCSTRPASKKGKVPRCCNHRCIHPLQLDIPIT
eukprot:1150051-Pelagomonas_calceolata.AAC.6